jgi:hypothetical protein
MKQKPSFEELLDYTEVRKARNTELRTDVTTEDPKDVEQDLQKTIDTELRIDVDTKVSKTVKPSLRKAVKPESRKEGKQELRKFRLPEIQKSVKPRTTIGLKVPPDLAWWWAVQAKIKRITMTAAMAQGLVDILGMPEDDPIAEEFLRQVLREGELE